MKLPFGIDVSHQTLDYHFINRASVEHKGQIMNIESDILEFLSLYNPKDLFFVVEPTGTYSDKFFALATQQEFEIRVANPTKSSQYMTFIGILHKNDENAAVALTSMGNSKDIKLPRYIPQSEIMRERKQIIMTLNSISKQCNMLSNQIHAMEQRLKPSQTALTALKTALAALETQKDLLSKEIRLLDDDEAEEFIRLATSVVGIGPKSADLLLVYTGGFKTFEKKSQLSKFVGIVNTSHKSGTSVNKKGKITKNGPSLLRACLYNASKSARKHNNACKYLYERLRSRGKSHKVAMIAVVNKLMHQVFAVVKLETEFDNMRYLEKIK